MTHAELQRRNQLIALIEQVQDSHVIDEMLRMLRINFDDPIFVTTDIQKRGIAIAQAEYAEGKGIAAEDADREIDAWLNG
jgi:hypothetical protein